MRLIDADYLKDVILLHSFHANNKNIVPYADRKGYRLRQREVEEGIINAPTVQTVPTEDAISRNNAITSICQWGTTLERTGKHQVTVAEMKQTCADMLCGLPSVTPKVETCEDAISREQAKAEIRKAFPDLMDRIDINSILNELPSATPKQRTGKWINTAPTYRSDNIVCDLCGFDSIAEYNYCPNCGAKMEEQA